MSAVTEAILEPDLPIVDPHHHVWDRTHALAAGGPQPEPKHGMDAVLAMTPRYLLEELHADMQSGHNVIATVYMQAGAFYRKKGPEALKPVGETEYINGIAAASASGHYGDLHACAGIVGFADLNLGAKVAETLEAHIAAAPARFRGIRHYASYDPDPDVLGALAHTPAHMMMDKTWREGFARLAPLGLSFDAWLLEPQLPELIDLARAFPDTKIVLDHCGTPLGIASYAGKLKERFAVWKENIQTLAKCPNVVVKIGGLGMLFPGFPSFLSNPPASSEQLAEEWRPYVETCIEAFGPERGMFESNFAVDKGSCTYPVLWNAFKRITKSASAAEKTALYSGTATSFYRLDL